MALPASLCMIYCTMYCRPSCKPSKLSSSSEGKSWRFGRWKPNLGDFCFMPFWLSHKFDSLRRVVLILFPHGDSMKSQRPYFVLVYKDPSKNRCKNIQQPSKKSNIQETATNTSKKRPSDPRVDKRSHPRTLLTDRRRAGEGVPGGDTWL